MSNNIIHKMLQNEAKNILRKRIKKIVKNLSSETKKFQSDQITRKILSSEAFIQSNRISIYLSTDNEVNTLGLLKEMFKQRKEVFVPTYHRDTMEMVKLKDMEDYHQLPVTSWNIKQPDFNDYRENALTKGGLDLFLMPGVAFTTIGGRLGHGRGYYDAYIRRHFEMFPERIGEYKTIVEKVSTNCTVLLGLAFKEQIVDEDDLPMLKHDVLLDWIVTSD